MIFPKKEYCVPTRKTFQKLQKQILTLSGSLSLLTFGVSFTLVLASLEPAFAAGTVGTGTAASCTEAALNTALTGGGNIYFNCGTTPVTINVTSEKIITANTFIDGATNGVPVVTLSGGNSKRIFNVTGQVQLSVKNLTLANGLTADQGAAINNPNGGTLTIANTTFNNNSSTKPGEFGGGAIYSGPLGTVSVTNSTFDGNKGSIGGAIRILNSNLTVTNSTFKNNKAVDTSLGNGGAIYIDGANGDNGKINITGSTFTTNSATAYGGALFNNIYNNNQTVVDKSTFTGNTVGGGSNGQGAAIWSTGDPAPNGGIWTTGVNNTTLTVKDTTINGNTATKQGGGIWIARHPIGVTITNTTLSNNKANESNGGGIILDGANSKLTVTNSTIAGNQVNGAYSMGAGIAVINGQATILNSTIANNTANWQGGGILGGTKVTLKNTIVANNVAKNGGNTWNIKHNCTDPVTNGGNNLQFTSLNANSNECGAAIPMTNPNLGPLASNGGLTQTMALLAGSPAINTGNNTGCPTTDQRGIARPQGGVCDIGAFEFK
jgi:predicted outer membrane repeat protein